MDSTVSVILPAAGTGERFGCLTPKQYCHILHRPLIYYTVETFIRVPWINKIIVVSSPSSMEQMKECLSSFPEEELNRIHVTQGGSSRHKSIYLGLEALQDSVMSPEIVVIHDGVRPIVPEKVLEDIVNAARSFGAAGVVRPLVSTVISRTEEGFLGNSLDRSKYCASEMPQAFNYSMIMESYNKCSEYDLEFGTECLQIAQLYGNVKPKLIMSNEDLWKVTHKKDLYAVEGILKESIPVVVHTDGAEKQLLHYLKSTLCKKFQQVKMDDTQPRGKPLKNLNQVTFHQNDCLKNVVDKEVEHVHPNNATVHVILQAENKPNDHYKVSSKMKEHASLLRKVNSCVYYICLINKDSTPKTISEVSEIITDLLFSRSLAMSGQTLYI